MKRALDQIPIAVVGIGCRFPEADDPEAYWRLIREGRTTFRPIPNDRWNHAAFFHKNQREIDKTWCPTGSFIDQIKEFAALHFGIAPRRLEVMDPQQRLLIEATRVAIQDAGYEKRFFDRSKTGVFVGISVSEFKNIALARIQAMQIASGAFGPAAASQEIRDLLLEMTEDVVPTRAFSLSGSLTALAAAAISQTFDLGGPSYMIDAACASASVAVNDAVIQLRGGVIDSAIAGGCYLNLTPDNLIAFTRVGAISPTGACRPFDARADGFVQSDGVGVLFLKRLEDAMADGDRVYAVIRGTGCNNDGRGEGPMTPRVEGQLAALRAAYTDGGCSPASVAFFEAHGTATAVGDPVEIESLGTVLSEAGADKSAPALIGSVKGNIGHAMSAAGIAGLIKAIKVIEHRTAPMQPGYRSPNPSLGLERWPLAVSDRTVPLSPRPGSPLRVAVSAFGFGGTNSHLVLEEPPPVERSPRVAVHAVEPKKELPEAVLVSGPNPALLEKHLFGLADAIENGAAEASLADIAYTLNARRRLERIRVVIGATTKEELVENLKEAGEALKKLPAGAELPRAISPSIAIYQIEIQEPPAAKPKVAFLFPGQGAQKVGLLDHLRRRFPGFAERFSKLETATADLLPRPLSSYLYPDPALVDARGKDALEAELTATEVCQPAMAAIGLALAGFLEDAGVKADVSLGHSLGEFSALAHAGSLDPSAMVRLTAVRGRAMRDLALPDPGTMAAAFADPRAVEAAIAGIDGVWIANLNHPGQVSISGTHAGVARATEALKAKRIDVRPLSVSHAFHTPLLEGVDRATEALLADVALSAPKHTVASSIEAAPYAGDVQSMRATLSRHATARVDFARGLRQARQAGASIFVHLGAGSLLAGFARATLKEEPITTVTLSSADDDGGYELVRGLATLAALDVPVDFEPIYRGEGRRVVSLPETPIERQTYWIVKGKQVRPILDYPLPDGSDGQRIVELPAQPPKGTMMDDRHPSDALVKLFAQQAEILRAHAEIIAQQNRVLQGEAPLSTATQIAAIAPAVLEPAPAASILPQAAVAPAPPPPRAQTREPAHDMPSPEVVRAGAILGEPALDNAAAEASVRSKVLEIVAKISAFPKDSLRSDQRLVDELGFDSLMVADLGGAVEAAFPNLGPLPATLFGLRTTISDLVDHLQQAVKQGAAAPAPAVAGAVQAARAETPVARYRVVAREKGRAPVASHDLSGETWLLTDDGSELSTAIAAAIERRGARVLRIRFTKTNGSTPDRVQPGVINPWPEIYASSVVPALLRSGVALHGLVHASGLALKDPNEAANPWPEGPPAVARSSPGRDVGTIPWPEGPPAVARSSPGRDVGTNPVLGLHPLIAALDVPRIFVLTALGGRLGLERSPALSRNVLQSALLGYTKALARERPNNVVKAIDIDPATPAGAIADAIASEIMSGDLSVEVGLSGTARFVPELVLAPVGSAPPRKIDAHDVVLITGGAGEIGSAIALELASMRPKAIILAGRREPDERVSSLLAKIAARGTQTAYLHADVADRAAFAAKAAPIVEKLGEVTLAIHGAGVIEDAPTSKKSIDSITRVMNTKVLGVQSLLRAFPKLEDLVLLSSWAGRFGNAGQTDYAAASELIDRLAVAGSGSVRMVAIDWPPWASTAMVRTIPAAIQQAMKAEGVTFLEDREGIEALLAIIADRAEGIEVIGRELPVSQTRLLDTERFSAERHPYLEDHRLKDRAVVPMAVAIDWIARAAGAGGGAAVESDAPLVIRGLELVRGLFGGDTAKARVAKRLLGDRREHAKVEVRAIGAGRPDSDSAVAYRAEVEIGGAGGDNWPLVQLGGADEPLPFDLERFYKEHTFHGPMLRAIERIEQMNKAGISGWVKTSSPKVWMPESFREGGGWRVDPLVIDGSFQLAIYWAEAHLGKSGYPTGFDRLTVLRPFGAGPIRATLLLRGATAETFEGSIRYEDAAGLCAVLENVRGRFLERAVKAGAPVAKVEAPSLAAKNGHDIAEENWKIAAFPEVEMLDQRIQMAELTGLANPYFHVHAGTARNRSVVEGVEMLNFSSYNYLGFSGHPEVIAAAQAAIERYGTSVSASRIASGERPIHRELEAGLAEHVGVEDALVFVSGHATNVTAIGHLFDKNDLILHDSLIHDSILQGIALSGATRRPFPHNDSEAAERILSQIRSHYRRVLICGEGIYSMDGDVCDLPRLIAIKKRYKALLLIDEAHSIGVLGPSGRGVGHHFPGVDPKDVDLWMGTLSKSFASCGGYIAGNKALVRYLKYTAPGFVYSVGITPPNAAAALKALELMHRHPELVERLRQRSRLFLDLARGKGIDTGPAIGAAVVPVIVGNSLDCIRLSAALGKRRINVQPIVYPAVEDSASRLRFFLSATHTEEEIHHAVGVLVEELEKVRAESSASISM